MSGFVAKFIRKKAHGLRKLLKCPSGIQIPNTAPALSKRCC
jgi:hypothetical protein